MRRTCTRSSAILISWSNERNPARATSRRFTVDFLSFAALTSRGLFSRSFLTSVLVRVLLVRVVYFIVSLRRDAAPLSADARGGEEQAGGARHATDFGRGGFLTR